MNQAIFSEGNTDQAATEARCLVVCGCVELHRELRREVLAFTGNDEPAVCASQIERAAEQYLGRLDFVLLRQEKLCDFDSRFDGSWVHDRFAGDASNGSAYVHSAAAGKCSGEACRPHAAAFDPELPTNSDHGDWHAS